MPPIFLNNKLNYKRELSFNNPRRIRSDLVVGDPYFNNVVLFLKGDGTNGSTNIIDSSPIPKTVSVFGNTQISTAQSKYGGSSIYFDGNGDYLDTTNDLALLSGDYTIEAWVYPTSFASTPAIISSTPASTGVGRLLSLTATGQLRYVSGGGSGFFVTTAVANLSTWNHVAVSIQGGTRYLAVNGVVESDAIYSGTTEGSVWRIGANARLDYPYYFANYIDSLRITKGVARYTANFNPETDTFLNI